MIKYFVVGICIFLLSCKNLNEKIAVSEYRLIRGEGVGYIDAADTSLMRIYSNGHFEVLRRDEIAYKGKLEKQKDTLIFIMDDGRKIFGVFEDVSIIP